ncbi:Peptidoglycan binding-like [uncultured Caudovirales phage]|uniref:N-acetylmuramoyl-L-alanine amidase n=1 Tax=uncultured Caudovirales phage TaxID=2100421 RepID=A0A6J5RXX7_9CAUD|nr:Peptidoglycan binding-like [uncultured Caudovirales phage]CAB4198328.1 Peptidoglycan binding-like [uncultured Caudovirales phage]
MTRIPNTDWRPVKNFTKGSVNRPARGVVIHTAEGSFEGTIAWQNNAASSVSSHVVVAKDGRAAQCVDLDDKAWCQAAGNTDWLSIECEGFGSRGETLTSAQVNTIAHIFAWAHTHYGIPLAATDDPINGRGLGWHGMGGSKWGAHYHCPGAQIVAQRVDIINIAAALSGQAPVAPVAPVGPLVDLYQAAKRLAGTIGSGPILRRGDHGFAVRDLQFALIAGAAQQVSVDGQFGGQTETAVKNVQRFFHLPTVDGIVGGQTRRLLAEVLRRKYP